eukprot:CAMPEP_0184699164 /NCGR_PEP_ID=MMETSP0313-20130426/5531_1 /TAXON_ID=2792 /ORGANISM="Porphyridium aerugineum, Strain SAG 1380-2" /LENGTH=293 /DNA_ID=CAMNT_0027158209 /DNA_START=212 /DNA_END=1093 /DNA_ORIENTATION=+
MAQTMKMLGFVPSSASGIHITTQKASVICASKPALATSVAKRARVMSMAADDENFKFDPLAQMTENGNGSGDSGASGSAKKEASTTVVDTTADSKSLTKNQLIRKVFELAACTSRGQTATQQQKDTMEGYVNQLCKKNPNPDPVETVYMDGDWELVYAGMPLFKTNPFLAAAATPLLDVGQIKQRIDLDIGKLITMVDVTLFPGITGVVETESTVVPAGSERLEIKIKSTKLKGGELVKQISLNALNIEVPIDRIYEQVRGAVPETYFDTVYLDEHVRVSRGKSGALFIYSKA